MAIILCPDDGSSTLLEGIEERVVERGSVEKRKLKEKVKWTKVTDSVRQ